jgi:signal transduction histidine kinase/ActR/RegA family two-component response regulator
MTNDPGARAELLEELRLLRCRVAELEAERGRESDGPRPLEAQVIHAQKLESLGVLAGGIAHDFNNLLVGILGNAALALGRLGRNDPLRPTIEGIQAAGLRAADLTKQMLAYSGRGKFVVQRVNLSGIVEEMANLLRASISKRASFELGLDGDVPPIDADATQVRQVVMNLITNASEALGDGKGRIAVTTGVTVADAEDLMSSHLADCGAAGRYVFVEVTDTGVGMDTATLERMFDPFFTTKFMGRGLGLAAVLGIVRGHRGAVRVRSEVGRGTTFRVLFPVASTNESAVEPAVPSAEEWRGTGTVLVVDDEPFVRDMAADLLDELGFEAVLAEHGADAVRLVAAYGDEIDVVLLDLTMPEMSGDEALGAIHAIRPDLPVILMSGYSEQEVMARFDGRELVGFLQKPFQLSDLGAMLRAAFGRARRG